MKDTMIFLAAVIAAFFVAFAASYGIAFAQDTTVRVGDILSPWVEMLMSAVSVIIGGVLLYISTWVKAKFGIDIEARHREALQAALQNGAGLVLAKVSNKVDSVTIDMRHPLVKQAVQYVMESAPDAIQNFGLSPQQLAEKVIAKLGIATASQEPAVSATPAEDGPRLL